HKLQIEGGGAMYEIAVMGAAVLLSVAILDYVRRAWTRKTDPVLATWILLAVVLGLSLWMYRASSSWSWTANISLIVGAAGVIVVLGGVIAAQIRYGTLRVSFDRTQKICLAGGALIIVFWAMTKQPLQAYILVQCIAIIGYSATIRRLLKAKANTEPLFFWVVAISSDICAIYPAWVTGDIFAWIFLGRAFSCSILVIFLILRLKWRTRRIEGVVISSSPTS
ncbi:MAG: hypothetical protein U9M92_00815, partial [Patescibacteria group bacterium]|nr:hypothetical protein [Patescibacteria group bacterium]